MAKGRGYEFGAGALNFFETGATGAFDLTTEGALERFKGTQVGQSMVQLMGGALKMEDNEINDVLGRAMEGGEVSLERLNVTLWSEESKRAAEHLHILGVNAQTAAERIALLGTDPFKPESEYDPVAPRYGLDPGQPDHRTPSVTAPPRPNRFTPQYVKP